MDPNLQRLARELRAERCPQCVLENVASRIVSKPSPVHWFQLSTVGFAVCIAALVAVLAVWRWPNREARGPSPSVTPSRADQVRVAEQAGAALGYIGTVLLDAGKRTETIVVNEVVPPLRSGFDAASKTIKNKM
jgi:hypothetical protein